MKKRGFALFIIFLCTSILMFSSCSESCKEFCIKSLFRFLRVIIPKEIIWVDLGNGYNYLNEYAQLDQSGYPGDGIFYMTTPFILPKIEEYKFNENYITVKQKYSKQNSSDLLQTILYNSGGFGEGINTDVFPVYDSTMYYEFNAIRGVIRTEVFCDSVIDSNPYFKVMENNDHNYYIVEKHSITKYGPLSRDEFESKFAFLSLPPNLWIDE